MTFLLILIQVTTGTSDAVAKVIPPLERRPALYSLIYLGGFTFLSLMLVLSLVRYRRRARTVAPEIPLEIQKRLGTKSTNRALKVFRLFFICIAVFVFSLHVYWTKFAAATNQEFEDLSYKDLRTHRLIDASLKGWILDRSGKLDKAIATYRRDPNGSFVRTYPADAAFAQLMGTEWGEPGLERALFTAQNDTFPEAWQIVLGKAKENRNNSDVRLTIDRDLQLFTVEQLKGRVGAVVVLNPQTGELLAIYSNPSYTLASVKDEAAWVKLDNDKENHPLVNRALGEYYTPGSTFKTFIMMAAYRSGNEDSEFDCTSSGFVAAPGAKAILDDKGEVHNHLGIDRAYEQSCNQYFAQLAVKVGTGPLAEAAPLVGIGAYNTPEEALRGKKEPQIWNASSEAVQRCLAPTESTIVTGPKISPYDLALEGYGQGMASQMTPFQMALIASAAANTDGNLMKPKIEYDRPSEVYKNVVTPSVGTTLRTIMALVTSGPHGTGKSAFGPLTAAGITTGGKTGTAQKTVPLYDKKTGKPITKLQVERDSKGNVISQREVAVMDLDHPRIDAWFLCIAPIDRPQVAIAVIVEGGGYGAKSAAPIAAALVKKAKELGLLGPQGDGTSKSTSKKKTAEK